MMFMDIVLLMVRMVSLAYMLVVFQQFNYLSHDIHYDDIFYK